MKIFIVKKWSKTCVKACVSTRCVDEQFTRLLYIHVYNLRNTYGKHFPCFHTVIETRVEVWENKNTSPQGECFHAISSSPKLSRTQFTFTKTNGNTVFNIFYKITHRKLKRGNSLLYRIVNYPYCSWWRMRWRIMAWTYQSSRFQNVIL